ncbi:hypothetical protein PG990_001825 [Apiospora arundinis]
MIPDPAKGDQVHDDRAIGRARQRAIELIASCSVALVSVVLVLQPESIFGSTVQEASALASDLPVDTYAFLKGTLAGIVGVTGGIVSLFFKTTGLGYRLTTST